MDPADSSVVTANELSRQRDVADVRDVKATDGYTGQSKASIRNYDESASDYLEKRGLLFLIVVVTLGLGWILVPLYGPILWATIIALLFAPLHRRLTRGLKGRRTLAASLTLLAVVAIVIVPFATLTASLAREAAQLYTSIQSGEINPAQQMRAVYSSLPNWFSTLLERSGANDFDSLQERTITTMAMAAQSIATHAVGVGQDTFAFVGSLFITLYLAFFLIRDGDGVVRAVGRALPLASEHQRELVDKFATVVRASVKGNLLVAGVQGVLGGVAFWCLGVRAALLWGVVMAFLSLLPVIGSALIWLPVAIYLFSTGAHWQGIALLFYGVLLISLVDNVLRPILVGKDTQMPDYVVMIATLGGLSVFGMNGLVVGPLIAAMFISVWHIYVTSRPGVESPIER